MKVVSANGYAHGTHSGKENFGYMNGSSSLFLISFIYRRINKSVIIGG